VNQGVYSVNLGDVFPLILPFDKPYYLGVKVGTDSEMTPRRELTSVSYAFRALTVESVGSHTHSGADITSGTVAEARIDPLITRDSEVMTIVKANDGSGSGLDADLLDGQHAAAFAAASHPHSGADITSGIVAEARIDPLITRDSEVMTIVKANDGSGSGLDADLLDGQHASAFAASNHNHNTLYYTKAEVDNLISNLQNQITALQNLLQGLNRSGNDFIITNANLYIQSGSGATGGAVNGKGNLIIGYNELRGSGDNRSGSHNLIVGNMHNYSSYGGIVVGYYNTISGSYSSVSGGYGNTASATNSSVSGGEYNTASGNASSVSGGTNNTASNDFSSVSGGSGNAASSMSSSVSGGYGNNASGWVSSVSGGVNSTASSDYSSVSGGLYSTASGYSSSVSGGNNNIASGQYSSVSGGRYNKASGDYSSVAGGGYTDPAYGNEAFGHYSSVSGGTYNVAGDRGRIDHNIGQFSSVSGGSVNTASGQYSSVSGGEYNTASGYYSSVSGGFYRSATGTSDWAAGGLWQDY
jgi:hypothetical protein